MNEKLKALYKSVILANNQSPYRFEINEDAKYKLEAYNALCGDRFTLFFDLIDDKISNLTFHGFGCAISKASTSILVKKLEGKTLPEALNYSRHFLDMIAEGSSPNDEELEAFAAAKQFPGREQCAILSWEELYRFLENVS